MTTALKRACCAAIAAILLGLHGGYVAAQGSIVTPGTPVAVTQSYAYASYGGGDFVFSTSVEAPGCTSGWYLHSSDPGYKAVVATILTAQAASLQIVVYGDTTDIWSGSPSGVFCHVQAVGLAT